MYRNYFLNRPDLEKESYKNLLDRLNKEIGSDMLNELPAISFLMLKPDAHIRGLMPEIVNSLVANKVYPLSVSLVKLTQSQIESLYMFVKQKYADTWWVMEKAYTLAPCLPMLVVGDKGQNEHLCEAIRRIIGPTTPIAGEADEIRYKYSATHRVFNLIHGSDDPAAAVREALVFFGLNDLKRALEVATELKTPDKVKDQVRTNFQDFLPEKQLDLRYSKIKLEVKRVLLDALHQTLDLDYIKNKKKLVGHMHLLLNSEENIIEQSLPLRQERGELSDILRNQCSLLSVLIHAIHESMKSSSRSKSYQAETLGRLDRADTLCHAIFSLTDEVAFRNVDFDRLLNRLVTYGISLDQYQETVLHTGWAVAPQELVDFHLKTFYPTKKLSSM